MQVVLVSPEQPANVGSVARAMANFAVEDLVLVNPECTVDAEAIALSKHARSVLEQARYMYTLPEAIASTFAIATTGKIGKQRISFSPRNCVESIEHTDVSLVFGRESVGLSNAEIDLCDTMLHIPTAESYPVMNLSHAVTIVLYELYVAQRSDSLPARGLERELRTLEKTFKSLLDTMDYPEAERQRLFTALRSACAQSLLSTADMHSLIGFFRTINKRVD